MRVPLMAAAFAAALAIAACGAAPQQKTAAPPPARAIAAGGCSPITYGGPGRPQLLIAASNAFQGQFRVHGVQAAQALKLVLADHHWKAGRYRVGLQICDETTATSDFSDPKKCTENARAFARNRSVVAVVGPLFSSCAAAMLPILSAAPGGGLLLISGSSTYLGLTRAGPGVGPGEPASHYRGARNFVRVVPADDVQSAAAAVYVKDHGARRPFVLTDRDPYGEGIGEGFAFAARRLGLEIVGTAQWNAKAKSYRGLAARVAAAHPDAVLVAGYLFENGPEVVKDLRTRLPRAQIIGPDGMFQTATMVEGAGDAAEGFATTFAALPARVLTGAGRAFAADFRRHYSQLPCCYAVNNAEATRMVLNAIADAGPSRAKVRKALFGIRVDGGYTAHFAIDRFGDTTLTKMAVYRIEGGQTHFDTVISPSRTLLARR